MRFRLFMGVLLAGMLCIPASVFGQQAATPTLPPGLTIHIVQRGETLFRIAQQFNTTVNHLAQLNQISDPATIYAGQSLLVPVPGAPPSSPPIVMHIVQPGETIDSIAQLYSISVDDLKASNHITDDPTTFYVGQLLNVSEIVSTPEVTATTAPTEAPAVVTAEATEVPPAPVTPEAAATSEATAAPSDVPDAVLVHTVVRGDTIFKIARQYGVTVNDLVQVNHISNPQIIYAGQELIIPGMTPPKLALDLPSFVQSFNVAPLIFVEGETGSVRLTTTNAIQVSGTFINQNLHDATENDGTQHTLLVGIPVGTAANVYPLNLTLTDASGIQTPISVNIQIVSGNYGRERIQLLPGLEDLLNPTLQNNELAQLQSITSNFTPTRYFDGLMGLPVSAPLSSPFGDTRSYNGGVLDSIHTGTDFAAASGTPIMAPAAGKVVFVGPLDIRGNVTIIDHGWGVFTVYCHQTAQEVTVGEMVTVGQVIGLTGSTGRVTGPHLHWEMWIDGVNVDSMQWVSESFN